MTLKAATDYLICTLDLVLMCNLVLFFFFIPPWHLPGSLVTFPDTQKESKQSGSGVFCLCTVKIRKQRFQTQGRGDKSFWTFW